MIWRYGITCEESKAIIDALIEIAVRNGPRYHVYGDWDPVDQAGWAETLGEDHNTQSALDYCTAARALGIL
jgi:hypothetical protein